ncbi:hypothetical protein AB4Z10_07640 [Bosea sp. RAF48]|uniref:hypothetical protein n=1 Tax=Bosea sp. RAF48 TaxID=3237480 RepID=UPI003F8E3A20
MMTRRLFLASSLGAAALALVPGIASAQTVPIGAIKIQFSPTVTQAWGENVAIVKSELERTLIDLLGPSLQRGAGTILVVNVSSIWLASYAGGGGSGKPSDGGASNDYLESIATLYDRKGRELASYPIMSTELSGGAGAWYRPDVDQLRLKALARNNAYWIKRYVG